MPKTTKEIWNELSIHTQQALCWDEMKYALRKEEIETKWYSEEEVDKIIEQRLNVKTKLEEIYKACNDKIVYEIQTMISNLLKEISS